VSTDRWDLLHVFYLGVGRIAAASTILLYMQSGQWAGGNIPDRLKAAFADWLGWLLANQKRKPVLTTFSDGLSISA